MPESNYLHCLVALDGGNLFVAGGRAEEIGPDVQLDVLDLMLREERRVDAERTGGKSGTERKKLLSLLGFKNEQRYGSQLIVHKQLDCAPLRYRSADHGPACLARSARSQTIGRFAPS